MFIVYVRVFRIKYQFKHHFLLLTGLSLAQTCLNLGNEKKNIVKMRCFVIDDRSDKKQKCGYYVDISWGSRPEILLCIDTAWSPTSSLWEIFVSECPSVWQYVVSYDIMGTRGLQYVTCMLSLHYQYIWYLLQVRCYIFILVLKLEFTFM